MNRPGAGGGRDDKFSNLGCSFKAGRTNGLMPSVWNRREKEELRRQVAREATRFTWNLAGTEMPQSPTSSPGW